jgi:segregation and condensation protein B
VTPEPTEQPAAPADQALASAIESVLLVAGSPVSTRDLASVLATRRADVIAALALVRERLRGGIRLQEAGDSMQLVTAPENAGAVRHYLGLDRPAPLSRPALETLAIVAYRQPVTRPEIEAARGVNSDRAVQTLIARGLIEAKGHRTTPGRPAEYVTSLGFLEHFGIASLDQLPPLHPEVEEANALQPTQLGLRGDESI